MWPQALLLLDRFSRSTCSPESPAVSPQRSDVRPLHPITFSGMRYGLPGPIVRYVRISMPQRPVRRGNHPFARIEHRNVAS